MIGAWGLGFSYGLNSLKGVMQGIIIGFIRGYYVVRGLGV